MKLHTFLIANPFVHQGVVRNISVDPVMRRHSGQEMKSGCVYPIGLGYIAGALDAAGCQVRLMDQVAYGTPAQEFYEAARTADALVVPYSFPHAADTEKFFRAFPDKVRILVGETADALLNKLLTAGWVDFVITGEPDDTIVELSKQFPDVSSIKGLAYPNAKGGVHVTPPRDLIKDLDRLPFPLRRGPQDVFWDIPFFGRPTAWILPSRGCPYRCNFCAKWQTYGQTVRYRSPKNVVDEVEQVVHKCGIRCFNFSDDTFTLNAKWVNEICQEILERRLKIEWICNTRADTLREDVLLRMKQSGCIEIDFGLESADNDVLRYLQKDITIEEFEAGLHLAQKVGIPYTFYCIFGSPNESRESILKTIRFVHKHRPNFVSFNVLTPLPGSEIFQECESEIDAADLPSFDILHTRHRLGGVPDQELRTLIRQAYRSYYLSPTFAAWLAGRCVRKPSVMYWLLSRGLPRQIRYMMRSVFSSRQVFSSPSRWTEPAIARRA